MPGIGPAGKNQASEIGTVFDSELCQYQEIENHGLGERLRPRYRHESEGSFFTTEDAQPPIVSVIYQIFPILTLANLA